MPNLPSTMQFVDIPIFNMLVPKEGPKAVPINFDFTSQQTQSVDLSLLQQRKYISLIQSVFIDNSNNNSAVNVSFNGSPQVITLRPKAQGIFPAICPNPPKITASSGGGVVVPMVFMNMPVQPMVWDSVQTAPAFDGSGHMLVDDPVLEACVSGTNLNVALNGNGNNNVIKPIFAADELFSGSTATNTAQTITTGAPSYFVTDIDIVLTGNATTGVVGLFTVTIKDGATTIATRDVLLPAAAGTGNNIPVLHIEGLQFNSKANANALTITGSAVLTSGKLEWLIAGGLCSQIGP